MKRQISTIAAIALAGITAISCSTGEKIETLRQEIEAMRQAQEEIQKEQEDMRQKQADLQKEQENMGENIDRINQDLDKIGSTDSGVIGTIYENSIVEQPASYKGGEAALMKYIGANLRYPEAAKQQELQGRVIVKILIDRTGAVKECKIMKSLSPECDAEAQRLCLSLQDFIPAKHEGKNVSVWFTLPIAFKL